MVHRAGNGRRQRTRARVIKVMDGYRVDWVPGSIRLFEDITRRVGEIRAEAKAREPPDLVLDKLVKEIGNSHLRQGRASRRQHADHQGRRRTAPRVQHDVRRDRPDGPERDHQCTDGGVLHRPGPGIADRDAGAAAGRDVGRDGNHRRHADRRRA